MKETQTGWGWGSPPCRGPSDRPLLLGQRSRLAWLASALFEAEAVFGLPQSVGWMGSGFLQDLSKDMPQWRTQGLSPTAAGAGDKSLAQSGHAVSQQA